jgi:hypothetical protein
MNHNPFTFGNPIRDPGYSCGRKTEMRKTLNRLASSAHESTSIIGERRIGKTLLLYHLSNPALITATRRELVDLSHSDEIKGSPFFDIFANVVLLTLADAEVQKLLNRYMVGREFKFTDEQKRLAFQLGAGFPFFLQMAGHYLVDAKSQGLDGDALQAQVIRSFDAEAASHYEYFWSHCSESEKITLLAILALNQAESREVMQANIGNLAKFHPQAPLDLSSLLRRGPVHETEGECRLLSQSLERWIAREISAKPQDEESPDSVGQWLQAGGRESLEPVKRFLPGFKKQYWPIVGDVLREMSFELAGAAAFEILVRALLWFPSSVCDPQRGPWLCATLPASG